MRIGTHKVDEAGLIQLLFFSDIIVNCSVFLQIKFIFRNIYCHSGAYKVYVSVCTCVYMSACVCVCVARNECVCGVLCTAAGSG